MSLPISYFSLTSGITADICHLQGQENADISMFTDYSIIGRIFIQVGWLSFLHKCLPYTKYREKCNPKKGQNWKQALK